MVDVILCNPVPAMRRILVVEDDALIAQSLTEVIVDLGFECVGPVADLATGLRLATVEVLDAAILNLVIQGGTAYGVAAVLDSRSIPFAFASGVPHNGLDTDWKDRPFIEKPYSMDDVREILQRMIPHHSWTSEAGPGLTPPTLE
jgi:DNA-binding response OmpR family regulator